VSVIIIKKSRFWVLAGAVTALFLLVVACNPAQTPTTPISEHQQGEEYYITYRAGESERYILPTLEELEGERDGLARNYPQTVKGVWEPASDFANRLIRKRLPELLDLGVNTFHVLPHYFYIDDELTLQSVRIGRTSLTGEKAEREYIDQVVKAKKAGFAVSIMPSYFGHEAEAIPDLDAFDEFALQQARKWARVAEEYQVEYFSPISEYEKMMSAQGLLGDALVERVNSWNQRALAEVSHIFTGKIVLKVSQLGLGSYSAQSASGYDIFAIALGLPGGGPPLEEYRMSVQKYFSEAQEVAKRDDVEWMVGEFFLHIGGRSEEECVEIFRLVFEEYKRTLERENKPVGFTFFGWEMPSGKVRETEVVPCLKQFLHDIDPVDPFAH
jgi:hypothetical protein